MAAFIANSAAAAKVVEAKAAGYNVIGDPRPAVTNYVALHQINEGTYPSLAALMRDIAKQVESTARSARFRRPTSAIPVTTCISPPRRSASS